MENQAITYETQTYYPLKGFIFVLFYYIIGTAFIIIVARPGHNVTLGAIGWIALMISPILFKKNIQIYLVNRAVISVDNLHFHLTEYGSNDDELKNDLVINWKDIKSYNFSISPDKITTLTINLNTGKRKSFSFKDDKDQDIALKDRSVFSVFYFFAYQYGKENQSGHKIYFKPGFLTTKAGHILICSLFALTIAEIVFHFLVAPDTTFFSVIAAFTFDFIILNTLLKDKKFNKTIIHLRPLSISILSN